MAGKEVGTLSRLQKPPTLCKRCNLPVTVASWGGQVRHDCPHGMVCAIEGPYCLECELGKEDRALAEKAAVGA